MAKNTTIHRIQIEGTSDLIKLRKELDGYQQSLKKVKKETKDGMTSGQAKKYQELSSSIKSTRKELNQTEKALKGMNTTSKKGVGFVGKMTGAFVAANIATAAFSKVTQILGAALKNAFKTATEFEFQMAKVKAISGATNKEFKTLTATAKGLGSTTFFTASQVAQLQLNLSKLGFNSKEILESQEAILKLSQALGEDLGRTATVVAASIRGFGADTDQTTRFANAMAAAFANSALDIEKFQTSMSKVSAIAATAGFSFEETTALLGTLTDRGIEASIAGTSLRNILLHLQDPASDLAKRLGRTVHSGDDLVRALKELDDSGINVAGVMRIVDKRQVQAMESFIRSADAIDQFTTVLEKSKTAADDMSKVMEGTVKGSILTMKSAYEGAVLAMTTSTGNFSKFFQTIFGGITATLNNFTRVISNSEENAINVAARAKSNAMAAMAQNEELSLSDAMKLERERVERELKSLEESSNLTIKGVSLFSNAAGAFMAENKKAKIQERKDAMKLLDEQIAQEIEIEVAKAALALEEDTILKNKQAENAAKLSEQLKALKEEQQGLIDRGENLTEIGKQDLINANQKIKAIEEQIKALKTLGVEEDKETEVGLIGADTNINQATSTEMLINQAKLQLQQDFLNGKIKNEEDFNARMLEMQIEHLETALSFETLNTEERMALTNKLQELKIEEASSDSKTTEERINQMSDVGKTLMEVGKAQGENSKITAAGIKITAAATMAETGRAMVKQFEGLSDDVALGFPQNILAVASTLALISSFASSFKAFTGGGGGEKFANGGLTKGGMFKGASHANGGVKFAVGGRVHEAEGGEAIINKRSTAMFKPMLSAMNQAGGGVKFANGGFLSTGEKFAMGGEVADVQQMISGASGSTQVVMVESDVTRTQGRVSNIESQATF